MFIGGSMLKPVYSCAFFMLFFVSSVNATQCIGYFSNAQSAGIVSHWGNKGDQFSSVNMVGGVSWPNGKAISMYKSPNEVKFGDHSTYTIALPKKVYIKNNTLDLSVLGRDPFNTPLNNGYNAWLVGTVREGCRALPPGWQLVNDTGVTAGSLSISLKGHGLPSGYYTVNIPYTLAWGTDPNQSEVARIRGTWAEINPANSTGAFDVSFEVKNKCDLSEASDIVFNYGGLSPDNVKGNKKEKRKVISCLNDSIITFSLSPSQVDLSNGIIANIKVKDMKGNEITTLSSVGNRTTQFNIESVLDTKGKVVAGEFSGSSVLTINYQ